MLLLNFLKKLVGPISTLMIMLSLALAPFPNINNSYADEQVAFDQNTVLGMHNIYVDKDDCIKDSLNDDASAGVYKPGCEFNETLGTIDDEQKERSKMSVEGAIEQFIMYSFAAATFKSLFYTTTKRSSSDCPLNQNAQITVRSMQAGSFLYIMGEMKAKAAMKKAQEKAIEELSKFQHKAKMDMSSKDATVAELARAENQKQLRAYYALAQVYDDKIEGIKTKLKWSGAAEFAYLGSLATELLMVQAEKRMCDVGHATLASTKGTSKGTIAGMLAAASGTAATVYGATLCGAAVGGMTALQTTYLQKDLRQEAQGRVEMAKVEAKYAGKEMIEIPKFIVDITMTFQGSGDFNQFSFPSANVETTQEMQVAIKNDITAKTDQTTETTAFSTAAGTCASCPGCAAISATMASDQAVKNVPIYCCGADTQTIPNGYANIPNPSVMDKKVDIKFKDTLKVIKGLLNGLLKNAEAAEMLKPAVLNLMEQQYFATKFNDKIKLSPLKEINKIQKLYKQLADIDDNFGYYLQKNKILKVELAKILKSQNDQDKLKSMITKFKNKLIQNAYAADDSNFMETLGYTVLIGAASMVMAKFIVNKGLVKPKSRMITFGAMAAVNAGMMIFYNSKIKENKKQKQIILHEAQRFANSHGIKTEYGEDNGGDDSIFSTPANSEGSNPYIDTKDELACATSKKDGYTVAACPAVVPRNPSHIPEIKQAGHTSIPIELIEFPNLVNQAVIASAQGMEVTNSDKMKANLKSIHAKKKAMRDLAKKLIDDYDKNSTKLSGKELKNNKSTPLKKVLANFKEMFRGNSGNSGSTDAVLGGGLAAVSKTNADKQKEKSAKSKITAVVPTYPKLNQPSFDFDLGDSDGGAEILNDEQSLGQVRHEVAGLDLNQNNISNRTETSIFKLISNRYLRSYPVLLPRKSIQGN